MNDKEYYVAAQVSVYNTELQRWELEDRYIVLNKTVNFFGGDGDAILKPKGFEPDHVNQLQLYVDFGEDGRRFDNGEWV